jgi:hypothetical protein
MGPPQYNQFQYLSKFRQRRGFRGRPAWFVQMRWLFDALFVRSTPTLYSIDNITIGKHSVISQEVYLCTGMHNYKNIAFPLATSPIVIEPEVLSPHGRL